MLIMVAAVVVVRMLMHVLMLARLRSLMLIDGCALRVALKPHRWAQHGSRNRAPDRDQQGEQDEQAKAKELHVEIIASAGQRRFQRLVPL